MKHLLAFALLSLAACQTADESPVAESSAPGASAPESFVAPALPPDLAGESVAQDDLSAILNDPAVQSSGYGAYAETPQEELPLEALSNAAAASDTLGGAPSVRGPAGTPARAPTSRSLVRTADVRVDVRDYARAREQALAVAGRMGAVVSGENEQRTSYEVSNTLTLRVDAARFDSLIAAVAGLGEVTSRNVSVEDVTEQAVDLAARLRARRAVEARYIEILGRADSVEDVLAVERQLAETREEIERADAQLRDIRDRVALSTLRLTLLERSATGIADGPGFGARLADAFGSGWEGILGLLVGLVALWPLVFIVPLAVWLWHRARRVLARRRVAVTTRPGPDRPAGTA